MVKIVPIQLMLRVMFRLAEQVILQLLFDTNKPYRRVLPTLLITPHAVQHEPGEPKG
jgi:hypothetical protein